MKMAGMAVLSLFEIPSSKSSHLNPTRYAIKEAYADEINNST